ncbi:MAG TPA: alpha/beta fold hydrolase [Candidatus Limnocylindrales bacterium]|nr:alpha/beta fold hydrolase [Candidatus Limnocylindrales bacterium]
MADGFVVRDGVRIAWERFGSTDPAAPAVLLMPTWQIVHSRLWKLQVPDLARHATVLTFDPPGNGRSDRPQEAGPYDRRAWVDYALAVLDANNVERAVVMAWCDEGQSLWLAAEHPQRVAGLVLFSAYPYAALTLDGDGPAAAAEFDPTAWPAFVEDFFERVFSEPHSSKPLEDAVGWGLETDGPTIALEAGDAVIDRTTAAELATRIRCPALIVAGADDRLCSSADAEPLARLLRGRLELLAGSGHAPLLRQPIRSNLLLRAFLETTMNGSTAALPRQTTWTRALARKRRALYLSSPIGLGHAMRDAAIAEELRKLHPDLEIDWLAQHPVTAVLETRGERIHPLSAELASESGHFAAEASGHDLNAFQAIRRMDEILVANFMVFHDAVTEGEYDLVIGDEAWDVDHFLHENPELKRTAFAWMTDFVGWIPMPDGGEREAFLTADYNAEMIEHVERFPRLRDRSIFVGNPDDIVPDDFGPGLGSIRDWTERHFAFSGYITGFDPAPLVARRDELRRELGYRPDERVVIVTVGGSGVGETLLRRVVAAYPEAARLVPGLRMIAVAGPRIDPAALGAPAGVEVVGFVPDLYRHLVASDLAVVQGGLTTTMELAAAGRPFLYFPLANHFEQRRHVRHRLERYGAGRFMEYADATPEVIAAAIAEEIDRPVTSLPVETDGAAKAAAMIAELV